MGTVYPGGKDREEAICPYCGNILESRMTSQFYYVKGLEDDKDVYKRQVIYITKKNQKISHMVKLQRAQGECLGTESRRRT